MKTSTLVAVLLLSNLMGLHADQTATTAGSSTQTPTLPAPTDYHVVSLGANQQIWQRETYEAGPGGQVMTHVHSYTELASGLNYWNNGQWQASQDLIETYASGAVAQQGQYQVIFANNLNSAGSIDMQTTDGQRLRSNILGLMYVDTSTGNAVMIATVQDSDGELISSNQVLYPNAFAGVTADVQYTYKRGSFEQDVILREQPPSPAAYGLNSDTTELEVVTEFIDPPSASVTDVGSSDPDLETDQSINWGATRLGNGKAFNLDGQDSPAPVSKQYINIQGRYFLLEKVLLRDIKASLLQLPEQSSNQKPLPGLASKNPVLPKTPAVKTAARPIRMAATTPPNKGYVLDYVSLNTAYTNYVFQRDTTYYLSGTLTLSGTNTFEGGTVIKCAANATISAASQVIFDAGLYHPVVFTAKDDNTVGETVSGSSGSPSGYYANPALSMSSLSAQQLSGLRVSYAETAISIPGTSLTLANAQFVHCGLGIALSSSTLILNNALFVNVNTNFLLGTTSVIMANNVTFDNAQALAFPFKHMGSYLYLTNCILANVTNLGGIYGGYNGFYNTPPAGAPTTTNTFYPFNPAGAAGCYLTNGCAFFNAGTTNVDANDLALLPVRTTRPPIVVSNLSISVASSYSPQVQRGNANSPDLGYHYDPLDYVFGGVNVYSNLTFTAGTAVGYFELPGSGGAGYGISIFDKVILALNGNASQPCTVARYSTVQEGSTGLWKDKGDLAGIIVQSLSGGYSMNPTNAAQIWPTFTRHFVLTQDSNHYRELNALTWVAANNSEFYGGGIGTYWVYSAFTNCLFDRVGTGNAGGNSARFAMRNCTVHGGSVNIYKAGQTWPVWIEDSAFDRTSLAVDDNSSGNTNITYCDFNAFITNYSRLPMLGTHDVTNLVSFNWQSSWLGNYYLPSDSPLINAGSVTADKFGLYHFTTQTNQTKETNSIVDIGYHYVAVNALGNPIDSNGDGIPDYLEDSNGDGLVDDGESPWMPPPTILSQPASQTVVINDNAAFSVTAAGIELTFQWYSNSIPISNATNTTLTLDYVQTNSAGSYDVIVSNPAGSVTSSNAVLDVVPILISAQPTNQAAIIGNQAVFTVLVGGAACGGPYTYQWLHDGTNLTDNIITTVAGNDSQGYSGDGGVATNAQLSYPNGVAVDVAGNLYIADTGDDVIRRVDTNGIIWTVAGTNNGLGYGNPGYFGDGGAATSAGLDSPSGVAVDAAGNLYIADTGNNVIRRVDTNGIITTVAGNDVSPGYSGDGGAATNAQLSHPFGVAVDATGNLYIADTYNYVIRKVDTSGIITTVAGNNSYGYSGDGGAATNAQLSYSFGVAVDAAGNLYIADSYNCVIRRVDTNGIITTVAGNDSQDYSGDGGAATNAQLNYPYGVAVDAAGNLCIADTDNNVIRRVDTNGIITTVAGNDSQDYSGDGGAATNAQLNYPYGVAVDAAGNLCIADTDNSVIRQVVFTTTTLTLPDVTTNDAGTYQLVITSSCGSVASSNAVLTVLVPPAITTQPAGAIVIQGGGATFGVSATGTAPLNYQWWFNGTNLLAGATNASLTLANVQGAATGNYAVVVSNAASSVTSSNASLTVEIPQPFSGLGFQVLIARPANGTTLP